MKAPFFILLFFCICTCFYFGGYMVYNDFYRLVTPSVSGIQYILNPARLENDQHVFAFVCALIPLCSYLTWAAIPLHSGDKQTLSALIILLCIFLAVYGRYKLLVKDFTSMVQSSGSSGTSITYPFEQLYFEYYIGGGLLVGCIICYLSFHNNVVRRRVLIR